VIELITKETTVSNALMEKPAAAQLLMSYGICNCCGGQMTLEESAKSKGINLDELLERVNKK
jgi:iron-sulfur cluster repair protein YtfE (RIC family)